MFLKAKLLALGAGILSFLALVFRAQYLQGRRDLYKRKAETAEAQLHQDKVRTKIILDRARKRYSRRAELAQELDQKGHLDSLSSPNNRED